MASTGVLPVQVDEPELQALLGRVLVFHMLQPGTLGALMKADGAALTRNRGLRDQLVAWTQSLELARECNDYMVEQARAIDAYLKPRHPLEPILQRARAQIFETSASEEIGASRFLSDVRPLLSEQEFANHIAFAVDASILLLSDVDRLEALANSILLSIRAKLEPGGN